MNFRSTPQEIGNKSSANLASLPSEMGNRSPPPLDQFSSGALSPPRQSSPYLHGNVASSSSGALSPPRQSSPYHDGTGASRSHLNITNSSVGGTRSPFVNSGLDFQGLHTQSPPLAAPGNPNESNEKYPAVVRQDTQNGYGNASPPAGPRNYLAGFKELP